MRFIIYIKKKTFSLPEGQLQIELPMSFYISAGHWQIWKVINHSYHKHKERKDKREKQIYFS